MTKSTTKSLLPKKLLLIDDHALARTAVKALLKDCAELNIIAEAASGSEALQLAKMHLPDVILLDIELPDLSGVEVAKRLLQIRPFRIIVLTSHTDSFYIGQLLRLGIHGYLSKNCQREELIQALLATEQQTPYIDQLMTESLTFNLFDLTPSPFEDLSQRELEILLMLCHGEKIAFIAKQLFLSPKTISMHRQNLFKKMQVKNSSALETRVYAHIPWRPAGFSTADEACVPSQE